MHRIRLVAGVIAIVASLTGGLSQAAAAQFTRPPNGL